MHDNQHNLLADNVVAIVLLMNITYVHMLQEKDSVPNLSIAIDQGQR
jgi:hypothetical protein